ncbi:UvrB/UvrC protein [Isosphaera pallida ATCC 43644]|uniref:UvrB/UvrC protein n=1 Tax=Isosphaera pallida (strain ATCC 43644 / DSM 9630 / IS1B) TaxID=575540 RepID=E8QWY8_ISOPI|nr:UvrB/UvrC motif-containing protein [Isosphaera pallida]ADV64027.1 UvrB/UvrC protein [Isosphaera pallida ATCC 43644]
MKCQRCSRTASFHITDIERKTKKLTDYHLCEECASKFLNPATSESEMEDEDSGVGVVSPMSELAKKLALQGPGGRPSSKPEATVCPVCGITFADFRSTGRLGCPHDYEVFRDELMPLLENVHNHTVHKGKSPKRAPSGTERFTELIQYRNQLKVAIATEDYETAAKLRDQIRDLEQIVGNRRSSSVPPSSSK